MEYPRPAAPNYLIIFSMFVCDSPDAQTDSLITITPRYSPPNKPIGIKIKNMVGRLWALPCYYSAISANILNVLITHDIDIKIHNVHNP